MSAVELILVIGLAIIYLLVKSKTRDFYVFVREIRII
jgi:hypothetical protein